MRRTLALVVVGASALAACAHDGRNLRPPGAAQNQSIVTTTTSTTRAPSVGAATTSVGADDVDRFVLGLPWADSGTIGPAYTCKGAGTTPRITWAQTPAATKELALTVTDDTANGYVHWVVAGIDPNLAGLSAGALPATAVQALNGAGTKGWTPPCPPPGSTHRYRFTLYALSAPSGLADGADAKTALATVGKNVLALDVIFGLVAG